MPWVDFDDDERAILEALFDTLIPPDEYPSGWEGGVETYLESAFRNDLSPFVPVYKEAIRALGKAFVLRSPDERVETLKSFDQQFVALAATHAAEGYYAYPGPGWEMIGYRVTA